MKITINGKAQEFDQALNMAGLLQTLDLSGKRLAVEVNEELVPRSQFDSFELSEGDQVEIVQAIGGG